ncbi:D-alanine--D-alanine ligase [Rhodococcus sp. G-MC3]|uniref:ATP-binding protein n=1 Tax=Rhodococcus sp. G-MC3 TaxID=3046209 RepID=UPI0024BA7C77|nr:D-alanine--D-alanine ligase [Rhodococcus sp. G-MC3]MDJ0392888.1 D-alanine--D-alanine ligase [Rhodococcus sp. G-MC3]
MVTRTVLALVGSAVDDFHAELSRVYAKGFLAAFADEPGYRLTIAFVSPDGGWCFPSGVELVDISMAQTLSAAEAIARIAAEGIDVMVPQMFCRPGMTSYRSLFDLLGVPYLGNTPEVMAMTADKSYARAVVAAAGVAVPRGELARAVGVSETELPVVVKPVDSDNSMGVALVRDSEALDDAISEALKLSRAVLIEQYIELGREVRCGIVVIDGELMCLPLEEYAVDKESNPIRGRSDKLDRTPDGDLYLVAKNDTRAWIVDVDDPITEKVWAAARRCHVALGCRHYSLFDFRIDPDGEVWFLEAGLYCSYSPSSVVAVMAAAAGISVTELFAHSLGELSRERTTS